MSNEAQATESEEYDRTEVELAQAISDAKERVSNLPTNKDDLSESDYQAIFGAVNRVWSSAVASPKIPLDQDSIPARSDAEDTEPETEESTTPNDENLKSEERDPDSYDYQSTEDDEEVPPADEEDGRPSR